LKLFHETLETSLAEISRLDQRAEQLFEEQRTGYHQDIEHIREEIVQLKEERQSLQGILTFAERVRKKNGTAG
jgi:DNA anti-recombination protein RmuC